MLPMIETCSRDKKKNSTIPIKSTNMKSSHNASKTRANTTLSRYTCDKYNHECFLPDYKLLSIPRTNNYYAMTGGCPCIPRAAAHPGSWRVKAATAATAAYTNHKSENNLHHHTCHCHAGHIGKINLKEEPQQKQEQQQQQEQQQERVQPSQMYKTDKNTYTDNVTNKQSCIRVNKNGKSLGKTNTPESSKVSHGNKSTLSTRTACPSCSRMYKSNSDTSCKYDRIRGPHCVYLKNTAIHGKCDTFGNLAFAPSLHFASASSVKRQCDDAKIEEEQLRQKQLEMLTLQGDLEQLILDEHAHRTKVESDIAELNKLNASGKVNELKDKQLKAARLRELSAVTKEELTQLLNNIHTIVHKPLNQTNMERVQRTLQREQEMQRCRELIAAKQIKEEEELEKL